jgi:hypothetical protein
MIALAIFLLAFVVPWSYLYWRTERDLQAELQRIREAGEPTSLSDLVPPQIPDEENAAVVYAGITEPGGPLYDSQDKDILRYYVTGHTPLGHTGPPVAQQARAILSRPAAIEVLETLARASHMSYATQAEDARHVRHGGEMHDIRTLVKARTAMAVHDGDDDGALQWLSVLMRIDLQERSDPVGRWESSGYHVKRSGWQVLREVDLPPDTARALFEQMPTLNPQASAEHRLMYARASFIDGFRGGVLRYFLELGWELEDFPKGQRMLLTNIDRPLLRPVRNVHMLNGIEVISRAIETVRAGRIKLSSTGPRSNQPGWSNGQRPGFFEALHDNLAVWVGRQPLGIGFHSEANMGAVVLRFEMEEAAHVNIFRTALALVAHKGEHGTYPKTLSDLDLPDGIDPTEDPFSGSSLKYRRRGDRFEVYSVGPNSVDESGEGDDIAEELAR